MKPSDPRLALIAARANVRPPHVYHCLHSIAENPRRFCPDAFALFSGLERRHVDRIMAALADAQLLPTSKARDATHDRGTRLPPAMELPDEWLAFAQGERKWSQATVEAVFQEFLDYWHAAPGQKGVKLDWLGTWRNWCRRAHEPDGSWAPGKGEWTPERREALTRQTIDIYRRSGRDHEAAELERSLKRRAVND